MRRRFTLLVASAVLLVLVAFCLPLLVLLRQVADDRATAAGTQQAQTVATVVAVATAQDQLEAVLAADAASGRHTAVYLPGGQVVGGPIDGVGAGVTFARREARAFTLDLADGRAVFVPVTAASGPAVVVTWVPDALLHEGVRRASAVLVGLAVVVLLVLIVVADRLGRSALRPVNELARTARRLADGDLAARAPRGGAPEVDEVGHALDLLAGRIVALLAAEREQVADLSHRLRTPLTALRLDVEALPDDAARERLARRVETLTGLVTSVVEQVRRPDHPEPECDAVAVVRERVAFWRVLAEDQERPVSLDLPHTELRVAVSARDLEAALDVLLENVFTHTAPGTAFAVSVVAHDGGGAVVQVSDAGAGLAHTDLRRGASRAGSTGLGLDIARRTADDSGGRLVVGRSDEGGAHIRLELGPPRFLLR